MPSITVAAAVWNGAETLGDSLASVRAQTVGDFELLVLDDGSTDESADIAASYGARVITQENQGLGAARKRLVEEAKGDFIAFIDADDMWLPAKLELQIRQLEATMADLVHADCWYVHEDGREQPRNLALGEVDAFEHVLPSNLIVASSAVFNRRAVQEAGNFVADTVRCSDWYGWLIMSGRGAKFAHLPQRLVRYTVRESSLANAGMRFHEAQRYLLEDKILPRAAELFARLDARQRARYERLLRRQLGVVCSSLARELKRAGQPREARMMSRKALRYAGPVFRVLTRALRAHLP